MVRPRRTSALEPRLELTPLMDVMFLLLTFFILAFVLMVRLEVTDIRLPGAGAGQTEQRQQAVVLALVEDGSLTIDGQPTTLDTLLTDLQARLDANPGAQLVIATDTESRSGRLFELMDALRAGGFADLRFLRLPRGTPPAPAATPVNDP